MKKPIRLLLTFCEQFLKALMLDASTALCSSTFHLLITLFEKKYLVMSLVHLAFMSLRECPLVSLQFMSNTNSSCSTTELYPWYIILIVVRD